MPKDEPGAVNPVIGDGESNSEGDVASAPRKSKVGSSSIDDIALADRQGSEKQGHVAPTDGRAVTDFAHPAAAEPQRIIWLADDRLGLARSESRTLNEEGIETSTEHATMNEKGKVDIEGYPPGENPAASS